MFLSTLANQFPSTETIASAIASTAATTKLICQLSVDWLPSEVPDLLSSKFRYCIARFSPDEITLVIQEYSDDRNLNKLFSTDEKVDPALLHRDCLDVHVHMPCYLWFILKTLAFNYHGIKQHSLFPDIENLLMHTKTTAVEIVKQLRKDEDANNVLKGLFEFLKASEAKRVAIQQLEGKGIVIIIQSIDTVA
ncbi:hypothetical protein Pint_34741 [Pistacia integerrima]|uniref:Uncharacterized protein n=1 Tax=Pistacia integerrima TaxID=434235 RepID=A0ACC0X7Z2_9ROSI|nr:hypothetical protein Pint_34741 [Pistacia integerrima]